MRPLTYLLPLALFLTGCAHYEFDVASPPEFAGHVGRTQETQLRLSRGPFDYVMQAVEGRLVMRVINTSEEQIELVGHESFVVDPDGQSHPLRTQPIAPNSYAKLILPPLRPYVQPAGPTFGFGLGVGISSARGRRLNSGAGALYGDTLGQPVYLAAYDNSDNFYWTWAGETDARLRLTFRRENELFSHDFTFQRTKVK